MKTKLCILKPCKIFKRYKKKLNNHSIKVIYKEPEKEPVVKVIDNVFNLKKAIIKRKLIIIPYDGVFMVCHNKNIQKHLKPNIYLLLDHIRGDFILVNIDRKEREFKSLSNDDIDWYSKSLINKSFKTPFKTKSLDITDFMNDYKKKVETQNNQVFEYRKKITDVLCQIELLLRKLFLEGDDNNDQSGNKKKS